MGEQEGQRERKREDASAVKRRTEGWKGERMENGSTFVYRRALRVRQRQNTPAVQRFTSFPSKCPASPLSLSRFLSLAPCLHPYTCCLASLRTALVCGLYAYARIPIDLCYLSSCNIRSNASGYRITAASSSLLHLLSRVIHRNYENSHRKVYRV